MNDRVIAWLDSLDLPPCDCGNDENALCPACARMIAVDRLRVQTPTWSTVRASIAAEIERELVRVEAEAAEWEAKVPGPAGSLLAHGHRMSALAYRGSLDIVRAWTPGARRA